MPNCFGLLVKDKLMKLVFLDHRNLAKIERRLLTIFFAKACPSKVMLSHSMMKWAISSHLPRPTVSTTVKTCSMTRQPNQKSTNMPDVNANGEKQFTLEVSTMIATGFVD